MVARYDGVERRILEDRRSGNDRRTENRGLRNAFLFSLFLDRRSSKERRSGEDRRSRVIRHE